jgi:predicted MFS family arabinose efflux permease
MLAVALIPIGAALGAPPSETVWLVSALYLATAVGQPVVGRLVDLFGPRPLYLAGTGLVGAAGLLGAVAPNLGVLVVARVLLGLGTCAGYPAAMYLIRHEGDRTGRHAPGGILTALSISAQVTSVIGPTLGGLLIGLGGWRTIFTVNIPLAAACLWLGAQRLPRTERTKVKLDVPGMVLFAAMLGALLAFLMDPRPQTWYFLTLAGLAAAAFITRETRQSEPFLDVRVLKGNGPMLATYARQLLNFSAAYAFFYGYVQWVEESLGFTASAAGLVMLPLSVTAVGSAAISGRRPGIRGKLLVGGVSLAAASAVLLTLGTRSPIWLVVGVGALVGVPQGINGLANQNALYYQADSARMGSAAGLLRTFMYLGAMSAAAAVAKVFPDGASTNGLHELAMFMLGCAVVLLAVTLADRTLHRLPRTR